MLMLSKQVKQSPNGEEFYYVRAVVKNNYPESEEFDCTFRFESYFDDTDIEHHILKHLHDIGVKDCKPIKWNEVAC